MKLAVIFPGIGYHTDKPLLYYSKKLALHNVAQVVECGRTAIWVFHFMGNLCF